MKQSINPRRALLWLGTILLIFTGSGCLSPAYEKSEDGTKTYQLAPRVPFPVPFNRWEVAVDAPIRRTHRAVISGFRDLKLSPITNRIDSISGTVDAVCADGRDVDIKHRPLGESVTKISIRCGIGIEMDQALAFKIFRAIEKHLL